MKNLNESLGTLVQKMNDSQYRAFSEARRKIPTATFEVQLNLAEAALSGELLTRESATRTVRKYNGKADNGTLITESDNNLITETHDGSARAKSDQIMYESMGLSEVDQRRLKNLPSDGTKLTSNQLREFRFWRSSRFSESDSLKLAKQVS
jgi:hypothetical protein